MSAPRKPHWMTKAIIGVAMLCAIGYVGYRKYRSTEEINGEKKPPTRPSTRTLSDSVELTQAAANMMKLRTVPAVVPKFSRVLQLRGEFQIDPNRLVHVHARFAGQVVELGTVMGLPSKLTDTSVSVRPLQTFDNVVAQAPMAVVWSKDLGEKKSQLAEALAKLRLDEQTLQSLKKASTGAIVSDRDIREQQTVVELDRIAVFTAEQTLKTYQVSEDEIQVVRKAAEKIHLGKTTDLDFAGDWARVIATSPINGLIVDKTVTVGEIVDANADLFKIADLTVLQLLLHAYEEDLPAIQQMQYPLPVSIRIPANPDIGELTGHIERIGPIIDPNEHMALLIGTIANPRGELRVGQFVTGEIGIPAQAGIIEIPSNALIDVVGGTFVYVQPNKSDPKFERRKVVVTHRYYDVVHVRSELSEAEKESGFKSLHEGEFVISGGVLELEEYQSQLQ